MPRPARLRRDVSLAPYTTLELGGPARYMADAPDAATLCDALEWASCERLETLVIGGGSNLVVADAGFDGLVVRATGRGLEKLGSDGELVTLRIAAGEEWDEVVAACARQGLAGIECLSGIPGSTGAVPIQNVGAYGHEISEVIAGVHVLDRARLAVRRLTAGECGFGYRTSRFRRRPGEHVVLAVELVLRRGPAAPARYPELAAAVEGRGRLTPEEVRNDVLALRRRKSMVLEREDPNRRSVGSFFLNPAVTEEAADRLARRALDRAAAERASDLPRFPLEPGQVKLSAAWLIERAGFERGLRRGSVGISSRHTLALVHHGGGTTGELLELAREIRDGVLDAFGIELHPEPTLVGCSLPPVG